MIFESSVHYDSSEILSEIVKYVRCYLLLEIYFSFHSGSCEFMKVIFVRKIWRQFFLVVKI